jgi:hypothetical protein
LLPLILSNFMIQKYHFLHISICLFTCLL